MNGLWDILSVAIGVSFIFMILSILNSWIQDYISTAFNIRANNLADIMQNLLQPNAMNLDGRKRALTDQFSMADDTSEDNAKPPVKHTVKKGDTLKSVSEKYDVPRNELQELNDKIVPNKLSLPVETTLKISYEVKANDTWETIKESFKTNFNVDLENLEKANPKAPPVGQTLEIPCTVQTADTLGNIIKNSKASLENLQDLNPDFYFDLPLPVDEELKLPQPKLKIAQLESREQKKILAQLLENPVKILYTHPVVHSLSKPNQLPDRIPTNDFTVALLDLLDDAGRSGSEKSAYSVIEIANIKTGIEKLSQLEKEEKEKRREKGVQDQHTPRLAFRLRSLLYAAQINANGGDVTIEGFQKAVSEWFDNTVARGSLWYKRRMQRIGIICGFILAIALNADTIGISNALWHNAVLRESISQAAEASAQTGQPTGEQAQEQLEELMSIGLPIGWSFDGNPDDPRALPTDIGGWISKIIGLVLTGFAISQGSQIWFDLMNRLLNLRSAGVSSNAEEPKEKEKSKQG